MYEEPRLTRITLEIGDDKMQWETPHNDCGIDEIMHGLFSLLYAATWMPSTIVSNMYREAIDMAESMNIQLDPYYPPEENKESGNKDND